LGYIRQLFSRKPDIAEYLEQNPFYANGCARYFNDSFERGIVQRAVENAEREFLRDVSGDLTTLLDGLYLRGAVDEQVWYSFSFAVLDQTRGQAFAEKQLHEKMQAPPFRKRAEEEIIEKILGC